MPLLVAMRVGLGQGRAGGEELRIMYLVPKAIGIRLPQLEGDDINPST